MTGMSNHSINSEEVAKNVYLLTKILFRLPVKSLIRFQCVSKHWFSLISDSEFSNNYTRQKVITSVTGLYVNSHPLINFEKNSPNGLPKVDFLAKSFGIKPTILHSCNGLMLCSCGLEMVVCNLTTRKSKIIPLLARYFQESIIISTFLAFYPMKSSHYKIVLVSAPSSPINCLFLYNIDIYYSECGTWKNLRITEPLFNTNASQLDIFIHGVLFDQAIYWAFSVNNLVRLDIDEEKLTTIQVAMEPHTLSRNIMCFGEYGEHLFLAHSSSPTETELRILEMDIQNLRWNIKYDINIDPVMDSFYLISNHHSVKFLWFNGGDEEETPTVLLVICERIYLYNPKGKCLEVLEDFLDVFDETTDFELLCSHKFIESLASP